MNVPASIVARAIRDFMGVIGDSKVLQKRYRLGEFPLETRGLQAGKPTLRFFRAIAGTNFHSSGSRSFLSVAACASGWVNGSSLLIDIE